MTGQVLCLAEYNHSSMLARSYVIPVETVTGSFIMSREIGQMKKGGTSISSIYLCSEPKELENAK